MTPSSNICKVKEDKNYSSLVVSDEAICNCKFDQEIPSKISSYLLKVGAASALTFSVCNLDYNQSNYHYSETIIRQETQLVGMSSYTFNNPLIDFISENHEIAFQTTELENLNPIPPNKTIRVKGKVISYQKGHVSRL